MKAAFNALVAEDEDAFSSVVQWLKGEEIGQDIRAYYRISERVDKTTAFRMLRSLIQWIHGIGYSGLILLFDEAERGMSISSTRDRRRALDNLRQLVDECGNSRLPGAMFFYAVPDENLLLDGTGGVYEALKQRLRSAFAEMNPVGVKIDLEKLDLEPMEFLRALGLKLLNLFESAYVTELPKNEAQKALDLLGSLGLERLCRSTSAIADCLWSGQSRHFIACAPTRRPGSRPRTLKASCASPRGVWVMTRRKKSRRKNSEPGANPKSKAPMTNAKSQAPSSKLAANLCKSRISGIGIWSLVITRRYSETGVETVPARVVTHPVFGEGVVLDTRWQNTEVLVRFRTGLQLWVPAARVEFTARPEEPLDSLQARRMTEAFRLGIVPLQDVEDFFFGREAESKRVEAGLEGLDKGNGDVMLVEGDYGTGKTHLLEYIHHRALNLGYAATRVEFDPHDVAPNRPKRVYRELAHSLRWIEGDGKTGPVRLPRPAAARGEARDG